jgi:hypothetical protein
MPRGISELARVTKRGGRVLMTVFGPPQKVEFFQCLVAAIQTVIPEFTGPPMDPPPLPFQLQDPEKLAQELRKSGLTDVHVETTAEKLEFASGVQFWDCLINSNPIVGTIFAELRLTSEQINRVRQAMEPIIRARAGATGSAVLTSPINIGIGTK